MRPWATVLRVPVAGGAVWFKASRDAFAHEAGVLRILSPLAPSFLPDVIASTDDGWLLLGDAGDRAREHPVDWPSMLRRYARLQQDATALVPQLLAAGAYDTRPERVGERIDALSAWLPASLQRKLRARRPIVEEHMRELAASPLPVTIDHGDLHDGNVFAKDGEVRLLDWGDSGVAHPFFSLSTADPEEIPPYLDAWEEKAPRSQLEREAAIVMELRFLVRALNWEHVAAVGEREHLVDRVERFVSDSCSRPTVRRTDRRHGAA